MRSRDHEGDILVLLARRRRDRPRAALARGNDARFPACACCRCMASSRRRRRTRRSAAAPAGQRKIVLATSIAETSLTIEGIRVVIDSGLRRYSEFDPSTGMSRLRTGKVSQAAADQRRGRAGRLSTGVCYRLWSEGVQASLAPQTAPEILHADLAPLALELSCWGTVEAPACAGSTLRRRARWRRPAICCASSKQSMPRFAITPHGRELAAVGAHPRLAHMLIKARDARDAAIGLRSGRLIERTRRAACCTGRARCGFAAARERTARQRSHSLPPGLSVDSRALQQAARTSANWQREFGAGAADSADPHELTGLLARARLSGSHCPRARRQWAIPARQWSGRALLGAPGTRQVRVHRGAGTRRRRSARRAYSWPLPFNSTISSGTSRRTLPSTPTSRGTPASRRFGLDANGASARWCSNPSRFAIRTRSSWRGPHSRACGRWDSRRSLGRRI